MGQVIRVQVVGPAIARLTAEAFLAAASGLAPVEQDGDVVWAFGFPGSPGMLKARHPLATDRRHWLVLTAEEVAELMALRTAGIRVIVGENEPESVLRQAIAAAASGCAFTSPNLAALDEGDEGCGPKRKTSTGISLLSRREQEIANLRALGRERAEIAAELMISENTVKTHLLRIHRKLGVQGMDDLTLKLRTGQ